MTTNRKANYNYSFDETIEAGIVLKGSEIKSIRESKIDISNAFAGYKMTKFGCIMRIYHLIAILIFSLIIIQQDLEKLLLNKREILKWDLEAKRKNLIIIPLKIFLKKVVQK